MNSLGSKIRVSDDTLPQGLCNFEGSPYSPTPEPMGQQRL